MPTSRERTAAIRKLVKGVCDTHDFVNYKRSDCTRRLKFSYEPHRLDFSRDGTVALIQAGLLGAGITYNSVRWLTGVTQLRNCGDVEYEYIEVILPETCA